MYGSRAPVLLPDRLRDHHPVGRQRARVVGDKQRGALGRNVLDALDLDAEPVAVEEVVDGAVDEPLRGRAGSIPATWPRNSVPCSGSAARESATASSTVAPASVSLAWSGSRIAAILARPPRPPPPRGARNLARSRRQPVTAPWEALETRRAYFARATPGWGRSGGR